MDRLGDAYGTGGRAGEAPSYRRGERDDRTEDVHGCLTTATVLVIGSGAWVASGVKDDVSSIRRALDDGDRRTAAVTSELKALVAEVRTSNQFLREGVTRIEGANRELVQQMSGLSRELAGFEQRLAVRQAATPAISLEVLEALTSALQSPTGEGRVIVVPASTGQTIGVPPQ